MTLVIWHNAALCGTSGIRPDAYGLYRQNGSQHGFFLEYDRGTMRTRDLVTKFGRYQAYKDRRLYERQYEGCRAVLVVATAVAESRVLEAIRAVMQGSAPTVDVLVATVEGILTEPLGMFGDVWRDACSTDDRRYQWPGGTD